ANTAQKRLSFLVPIGLKSQSLLVSNSKEVEDLNNLLDKLELEKEELDKYKTYYLEKIELDEEEK
ncbi:9719_t:CDS:2, partial [Dentiscutata erythropus]